MTNAEIIAAERARLRPPPQVKALFVAPFTAFTPQGQSPLRINDAVGELVADDWQGGDPQPRGWGHMFTRYKCGYGGHPGELMNTWEAFFDLLVGEERDLNRIAELLTEAWER